MIEQLSESKEELLVFKASDKLTDDDYGEVFLPPLKAAIEKHGKIKALLYLDENFTGWELEAAWDDAKFGVKHRNDFTKMAVVGGPKWVEWSVKLAGVFMGGEVKSYEQNQFDQALEWILS